MYLQNLNDSLPVSPPPFFSWSPLAAALTFSCVRQVGGGQIFPPVALKFLNLRHNKIEMKLDGVKLLEGLKTLFLDVLLVRVCVSRGVSQRAH